MLKLKFSLWLSLYFILFFPFFVASSGLLSVDYKFFDPLKLVGHEKIKGRGNYYRVYYNKKFLIDKVDKFSNDKIIISWSYEYSGLGNLKRCFTKKGWKIHSYFFNEAGNVNRESYRFGKRSPYKEIVYSYLNDRLDMKRVLYRGQLHSFYRYSYFLSSGFYVETQFSSGGTAVKHIYYRLNDANRVIEELHYSYGRLRKIYRVQYYKFGFLKSKKERPIAKMDAKVEPFKEDVPYPRP